MGKTLAGFRTAFTFVQIVFDTEVEAQGATQEPQRLAMRNAEMAPGVAHTLLQRESGGLHR
jgi:hypothetical protein